MRSILQLVLFLKIHPLQAYVKGWTATGYSFGKFMMNTYIIVFPKVVGIVDLHDHHSHMAFQDFSL